MSPTWWAAIDQQLLQRLLQRVSQPGVSCTQLAATILLRMQTMTRPLPLLADLTQRHAAAITDSAETPIVYAQAVRLHNHPQDEKIPGLPSPLVTQQSLIVHQQPEARGMPASQFSTQEQVVYHVASREPTTEHISPVDRTSPMLEVHTSEVQVPALSALRHTDNASPAEQPQVHASVKQETVLRVVETRQLLKNTPPRAAVSLTSGMQKPSTLQSTSSQPLVVPSLVQKQERPRTVFVLAAPHAAVNTSPPETWINRNTNPPADELRQRHPERVRTNSPVRTADSLTVSPVHAQGRQERGIDISRLADRVQRQLNLEQLTARVQGQLRRRLTIERERRGGR